MDEERALQVLAAIESGLSLRQACEHVGLPAGTFLGWCDSDADLAEHYARARERMLDMKAEELEEIGEQAARAESAVEVAGLRLQSDNRKWLLSKLVPKRYGEKVAIGGADDLPPIKATRPLAELSTEELRAALAKLGG